MAKPSTKSASPAGILAAHGAGKRVKFGEAILHGRLRFGKGEVVEFETPEAAAYFDAAFNLTELTDAKATRVISAGELNMDPNAEGETIDPLTIIGNGREGVAEGTTIAQALSGSSGSRGASLRVADATATMEG